MKLWMHVGHVGVSHEDPFYKESLLIPTFLSTFTKPHCFGRSGMVIQEKNLLRAAKIWRKIVSWPHFVGTSRNGANGREPHERSCLWYLKFPHNRERFGASCLGFKAHLKWSRSGFAVRIVWDLRSQVCKLDTSSVTLCWDFFENNTLPETNIAHEIPSFWWDLPGKMGIFMGYVSFREGTRLFFKVSHSAQAMFTKLSKKPAEMPRCFHCQLRRQNNIVATWVHGTGCYKLGLY